MRPTFSITFDRTGFPLVRVAALGLDVHLFPVTKLQFEQFLAEPNEFDDAWYQQVLQLNPRGRASQFGTSEPESAFLAGILPHEAQAFAEWLGEGFELPSFDQWQAVWRCFATTPAAKLDLREIDCARDEATRAWLRALLESLTGYSLARFARMQSGVLEWVTSRRGWRLLGEPREEFGQQLFSCSQPVIPTALSRRCRLFGFRLVRCESA